MLQRMTDMPGGTIGFEAVGEVEDDDWEETVEPGEMVLAGLRGDRWIKEVCREHEIVETLYNAWHEKLLEGGKATLAGKEKRSGEKQLRKKIAELERTLGSQDLQVGFTGHSSVAATDDRAACWPKDPEQTTTTLEAQS